MTDDSLTRHQHNYYFTAVKPACCQPAIITLYTQYTTPSTLTTDTLTTGLAHYIFITDVLTALGKLLTCMCLYYQAVKSVTGQWEVKLFGWEGNSGQVMAAYCRVDGLVTCKLNTCTPGSTLE